MVGKETVVFPGFDGGAEWGGSALDPETGVLYVNANDIAWTSSMRRTASAASLGRQTYLNQCAACHGENMSGAAGISVARRHREPAHHAQVDAIDPERIGPDAGFLFSPAGNDGLSSFSTNEWRSEGSMRGAPSPTEMKYNFTGYHKWLDPDGYPAVAPPWGTLNAINLNSGEFVWKIPLGEYPELAEQG